MELIGSKASPYVRRIRMQLDFNHLNYELKLIDIFSPEGKEYLARYTQIGKIPVLIDEKEVIWDSMLISEYILSKNHITANLDQKKKLVMIDEANDAALVLFQLKRFDIDPNYTSALAINSINRLGCLLDIINSEISVDIDWQKRDHIWLFCLLDWMAFREIFQWQKARDKLVTFWKNAAENKIAKNSDPRL